MSKESGAWGELCELLVVLKFLLNPAFFANALKFVVSNIAKHPFILLQKKLYVKITLVLSPQMTYINLTVSI